MKVMNDASTVEAKLACQCIDVIQNVTISHYHCDNDLFDTNLLRENFSTANQTMSFCWVNAYHQNCKADRCIGGITTDTQTSLLHASHRWYVAIESSLWLSVMKNYTNLRNNLPSTYIKCDKDGHNTLYDKYIHSLFSKFSGIETTPDLSTFNPFGSPVYVLQSKLQAGQSLNKWLDRSRVGIFFAIHPAPLPMFRWC